MMSIMSSKLEQELNANRPAIQAALTSAEEELAALRARQRELELLIARGRAALGLEVPPAAEIRGMTLHEAIASVLRNHGNRWMLVREVADAVNAGALYRKRDGSPVEPNQIHARTKNYESIFEKEGPRVRLREPTSGKEE